jgi:hypothetical protein
MLGEFPTEEKLVESSAFFFLLYKLKSSIFAFPSYQVGHGDNLGSSSQRYQPQSGLRAYSPNMEAVGTGARNKITGCSAGLYYSVYGMSISQCRISCFSSMLRFTYSQYLNIIEISVLYTTNVACIQL